MAPKKFGLLGFADKNIWMFLKDCRQGRRCRLGSTDNDEIRQYMAVKIHKF